MHRLKYEQAMKLQRDRRNLIDQKIREREEEVKKIINNVEISMQNLTGEDEYKIQNDPNIRKKFAELCSIMEIDPLLISKHNKPKREAFLILLKNFTKS